MINDVRSIILKLCNNKNKDWKNHIESVVKYSKVLAKKLGADEEICEISAWLHDISKMKGKKDHHVNGAKEAGEILRKYNYPERKIKQVQHCILTHTSDKNYTPKTIEAKIVASADALSMFDNPLWLFYKYFVIRKESVEQCRNALLTKFQKGWNKLLVPEAKEIAKEKYEALNLILKE